MMHYETGSAQAVLVCSPPAEGSSRGAIAAEPETSQKIEQTIAFMKAHLDKPLQAPVLAAQANISLSHYFALFKRCTGRTPIDYFIHLRMERARHLLEATALTVKEIAASLGYDDPFYFSRVFKSVNCLAPRQYRLACLNGARNHNGDGALRSSGRVPAFNRNGAVRFLGR